MIVGTLMLITITVGRTALIWAVSQGKLEVLVFLCSLFVFFVELSSCCSLIHSSFILQVVSTLLSHGANSNALDNEGEESHLHVIGSRIKSFVGSTPLMWASGKRNQDFVGTIFIQVDNQVISFEHFVCRQ